MIVNSEEVHILFFHLSNKFKQLQCTKLQCVVPNILYGCETWSLTMKEVHTLRVSEDKVTQRILGHKREEIIEE
jgi:hypothetical protein